MQPQTPSPTPVTPTNVKFSLLNNPLVYFLSGKKTYILMACIFVTGGLQAVGVHVPEWLYAIEAALGGTALRAGVAKGGSV